MRLRRSRPSSMAARARRRSACAVAELHIRGEAADLVGAGLVGVEPGGLDAAVVLGDVDIDDVGEPGLRDELRIGAASEHLPRSRPAPPADARSRSRPGSDQDRREGHAATRAKERTARAEHRQLRTEAAQDVGVHDGVEAPGRNGWLRPVATAYVARPSRPSTRRHGSARVAGRRRADRCRTPGSRSRSARYRPGHPDPEPMSARRTPGPSPRSRPSSSAWARVVYPVDP